MRRKGTGLSAQGKHTVPHLAGNAAVATASQPWDSPTPVMGQEALPEVGNSLTQQ